MSFDSLFPPAKGGNRYGNKPKTVSFDIPDPPKEPIPDPPKEPIPDPPKEPIPEKVYSAPNTPQGIPEQVGAVVRENQTSESVAPVQQKEPSQATVKQKLTVRPLLYVLVLLGVVLEVYFYYYRFVSDGTAQVIAIIASLALTGFLLVASSNWSKPLGKALTISLAVYSVIATSSGQAYSLAELETQATVAEVQRGVAEQRRQTIEGTIQTLRNDLERIDQSIGATVGSLEDRYEWKNTLAAAEAQRAEIIAEIDKQSQTLLELSQSAGAQYTTPNVYVYYSELLGIPARSIALVLQTMFSVFIASLAPFALVVLRSKQGEMK